MSQETENDFSKARNKALINELQHILTPEEASMISFKQIRQPNVFGAVIITVGGNAKRTGQIGLSGSGSSEDDHIVCLLYVCAGSEPEDEFLIELSS